MVLYKPACQLYNLTYLGGGSDGAYLLWAIAFGVFSAFAGDLLAKCFSVYGEGYTDPPSISVAVTSFLLFTGIPLLGANSSSGAMYWVVPIAVLILCGVYAASCEQKMHKVGAAAA